ncbi:MAG: hypothetical protein M1438_04840 [Deltaproteobacteria bacterium]|nr:hypothetical protein [Deltaproteobacteria bacterium]
MSEDWLSVALPALVWVALLYGLYGVFILGRRWRCRRLKRRRTLRQTWPLPHLSWE